MNLGEVKESALALAERPDLATSAGLAVVRAQRQLQRRWNWRCMEVAPAVSVAYPAGSTGVTVASDFKEAQAVWLAGTDGALTLLDVTSEKEARLLAEIAAREGTGVGNPRWYERGMKLVLLWPPAAAASLKVEYVKYLPAYDLDVDESSDWFTENLDDVMAVGAAAWLLQIAQETRKAQGMLEMFLGLAAEAWQADQRSKHGGQRGSYSPPLPGSARQFWSRQ
jgi:hypothetical protein